MSKVIFMFSGQGSQYANMGKELYKNNNVFRKHMDILDNIIKEIIGESVLDKLYTEDSSDFKKMKYTHLGIFMVEYSLMKALESEGIQPDCVVGTSMGEYAACIASGILELEGVLNLLVNQSKLVEKKCEKGGMLTILHDKSILEEIKKMNKKIELVSINYDSHLVVSGSYEDIKDLKKYLNENHVMSQLLDVNYGYHSYMIDEVEEDYKNYINKITINSPKLQYVSGAIGVEVKEINTNYLWDVVRKKIRFVEAFKFIENNKDEEKIYIDLGPSSTLINYLKKNIDDDSDSKYFPIMTYYHNDLDNFEKIKEFFKDNKSEKCACAFVGQGSQKRGMGKGILDSPELKRYIDIADNILGYSIKELCFDDKDNKLNLTQYSQPALYIVNTLMYLQYVKKKNRKPDYVLGHSLGEYCALFAAGIFDFETGLKIVKKRGELMGKANGGKMIALLGKTRKEIEKILKELKLDNKLDFANYNEPYQTVLSGGTEDIEKTIEVLSKRDDIGCVPLQVSGAFHSRYMKKASEEFENYIEQFSFNSPEIETISNYNALPYKEEEIKKNMVNQIFSAVRWVESVEYLLDRNVEDIIQIGEGEVITKLVNKIKDNYIPKIEVEIEEETNKNILINTKELVKDNLIREEKPINILGSKSFKEDFNLKYAYLVGPMYRGISSKDMIIRLARNGMLGFIGSTYMDLEDLRKEIIEVKKELYNNESFGVSLTYQNDDSLIEGKIIKILLEEKVNIVQLSGYIQITEEIAKYRIKSLFKTRDNKVSCKVKFIIKLSRPEVAKAFMEPVPKYIIEKLLGRKEITLEEAKIAENYPIVDSICVEANSSGCTDGKSINCLLPRMIKLRNDCIENNYYDCNVYVGVTGGIGTDFAAMSMFIMGADYIMTGSINQCTVESQISEEVKNKLQNIDIQDTDYAPGIDLFEFGAKVQVLKKGSFFCVKANKLYEIYKQYNSLDELSEEVKEMLIDKYFEKDFETIYDEMCKILPQENNNEKKKMALIFKWYLINSQLFAIKGNSNRRIDYQVYCSPALGAFNQLVKGTDMEKWINRHVEVIGQYIMDGAEKLIRKKILGYKELI